MTKTRLLSICKQIVNDEQPTRVCSNNDMVFESEYKNYPFIVTTDSSKNIITCIYKKVQYLIFENKYIQSRNKNPMEFYMDYGCDTRVYLYQTSDYKVLKDEDGYIRSVIDWKLNFWRDFAWVIPIK